MSEFIFRVVDVNGHPANERNNRRKNTYRTLAHARNAASQFNGVRIYWRGETHQLEGAPFRVQVAQIGEWFDDE